MLAISILKSVRKKGPFYIRRENVNFFSSSKLNTKTVSLNVAFW